MEFDGRRALVTGSSGMGLACALRLARGGAEVHLCGIDEALNAAADEAAAGLPVRVHRCDVADETALRTLLLTIGAAGFDILVNAAAIQTYGTVETTDPAHWDRVMAINLRAAYLTSHLIYPGMKARGGGAIVHFSSVQGFANQRGVLAYATTKGALHALTRAMAVDCARDGVRVELDQPRLDPHAAPRGRRPRSRRAKAASVEDVIAGFGAAHPVGRDRHAGGGRRAGGLPGLRPRRLHHRGRLPHRRRADGAADLGGGRCAGISVAGQWLTEVS